jgi:hypothetical protein
MGSPSTNTNPINVTLVCSSCGDRISGKAWPVSCGCGRLTIEYGGLKVT